MKSQTLLSCALVALIGGHITAQETESKKPDAQQLVEQLGDPSYQVRRDAEKALREMGKGAKDALEKAAENDKDSEVRWRAGRLLRNLEHQEAGGLRERAPGGSTPDQDDQQSRVPDSGDLNEQFEDVFRRLEQEFGVDVPRHRFFNDNFFQDLQQQMQDLQGPDWNKFGEGEGHSFQMRVSSDGVAVEIKQRDANGKTETKKYEAPSIEAFREKYPDIAKQYLDHGNGGGFAFHFAPGMQWDRGQMRAFPMPAPAPMADTGPRLGVYTAPMSADLRTFLGLEDDEGLLVESVVPDSLAQRLGIENGDVVLEVNGQHVGSAQDVQTALQAANGEKISAKINRRGKVQSLEAVRTEQQTDKAEKTKSEKGSTDKGSTLKPRASKGEVR